MTAQIYSIWIKFVQLVNIEVYLYILLQNITLLFIFFPDFFVHVSASLRHCILHIKFHIEWKQVRRAILFNKIRYRTKCWNNYDVIYLFCISFYQNVECKLHVCNFLNLNDERHFTAWHRLTLNPMGKCSNAFFSETTNMIKAIWAFVITWNSSSSFFSSHGPKVQVHVNYCHHLASIVCKLFTFQASSPKPLGQLEPNLAGMFLGWSSTRLLFFVPVGYSTWLPGPIICSHWLKFQRSFFSETNELTEPKL